MARPSTADTPAAPLESDTGLWCADPIFVLVSNLTYESTSVANPAAVVNLTLDDEPMHNDESVHCQWARAPNFGYARPIDSPSSPALGRSMRRHPKSNKQARKPAYETESDVEQKFVFPLLTLRFR